MSATSVQLPVSVLHDVLGTILIGVFMSCMLFGIECMELARYLSLFPTDRPWFRALVGFMFLVDLASTANLCAMIYLYTIVHYGDSSFLFVQNATLSVYAATTMVLLACMHGFLIYRYIALSKNWFIATALTCLACLAICGCSLSIWSVNKFSALSDRLQLKTFATIWLSTSAGSDIAIALALIWELRNVQSSFKVSRSLIRRLIRSTILTGSATATLAVCTLISYLVKPTSNLPLMFASCIGRVCTLTVLYNLNERKSNGRYSYSMGGSTSTAGAGAGAGASVPLDSRYGNRNHKRAVSAVSGIGVHQTSIVHVDGKPGNDDSSFDGERYDSKQQQQEMV